MIDTTENLLIRPYLYLTNPRLLLHLLYGPKIYHAESINDFLKDKEKVKTTKNVTGFLLPPFLFGSTWNNHYTVNFLCPVRYKAGNQQNGFIDDQGASLEVKLWYDEMFSSPASVTDRNKIATLEDNMLLFDCIIGYRKKDGYTWLIKYDTNGPFSTERTSSPLVELVTGTV